MSKHAIWGFTIEVSPSGRKIWPNKLKYEAARRIREDGLSPGEIAAEIGAHECLVRKWSVADRRSRGELISVQEPAFTEIVTAESRPPKLDARTSVASSEIAQLRCGSVSIEFSVAISEVDLTKLVSVVKRFS
jgi:transposase-like protein